MDCNLLNLEELTYSQLMSLNIATSYQIFMIALPWMGVISIGMLGIYVGCLIYNKGLSRWT